MKLIAHRGNLYGPSPYENNPAYVQAAYTKGFDVEIDVWYVDNSFWLGHDEPKYLVKPEFLIPDTENPMGYWCHAKNPDGFKALLDLGAHCFWHDSDLYTLTSHKVVWTYPGATIIPNAVWNQPEWGGHDLYSIDPSEMDKWIGICSDYVAVIKEIHEKTLLVKRDL